MNETLKIKESVGRVKKKGKASGHILSLIIPKIFKGRTKKREKLFLQFF